jgi:hypothetical protein
MRRAASPCRIADIAAGIRDAFLRAAAACDGATAQRRHRLRDASDRVAENRARISRSACPQNFLTAFQTIRRTSSPSSGRADARPRDAWSRGLRHRHRG